MKSQSEQFSEEETLLVSELNREILILENEISRNVKDFERSIAKEIDILLRYVKSVILVLDLSLLSPQHRPYHIYSSLYKHVLLYALSFLFSKVE